jgi:hypothetical protein
MKRTNFISSLSIILILVTSTSNLSGQATQPYYTATANKMQKPGELSFRVKLVPVDETLFRLLVENPLEKKLQIQISHPAFGTMIDTAISSLKFSRHYNLNESEDGRYRITVSHGKEKFSGEIELSTVTARRVVIR